MWCQCGVSSSLNDHLKLNGYESPSYVQELMLKSLSKNKDILVAAKTGEGKTFCYCIFVVSYIYKHKSNDNDHPNVLILVPTRELCDQIKEFIKKIDSENKIVICTLYGGIYAEKQVRQLKKKPNVIVATPGRIWDLISANNNPYLLQIPRIDIFIIDETDRMLQTGHFQQMNHILNYIYDPDSFPNFKIPAIEDNINFYIKGKDESTLSLIKNSLDLNAELVNQINKADITNIYPNENRITVVCSSTLTAKFQKTNEKMTNKKLKLKMKKKGKEMQTKIDPIQEIIKKVKFRAKKEIIDLTKESLLPKGLVQYKSKCLNEDRDKLIFAYLKRVDPDSLIIFTNAISSAKKLSSLLKVLGFHSSCLHSKMQQKQRYKNIDRFKYNMKNLKEKQTIFVCTDIGARGIDIPEVKHIIHYHVPLTTDSYINRSGRTARFFGKGSSLILISPEEEKAFKKIQIELRSNNEMSNIKFEFNEIEKAKNLLDVAYELEKEKFTEKKQNKIKKEFERVNEEMNSEPFERFEKKFEKKSDKKFEKIIAKKFEKKGKGNENESNFPKIIGKRQKREKEKFLKNELQNRLEEFDLKKIRFSSFLTPETVEMLNQKIKFS